MGFPQTSKTPGLDVGAGLFSYNCLLLEKYTNVEVKYPGE
jgi:hypothetical protein